MSCGRRVGPMHDLVAVPGWLACGLTCRAANEGNRYQVVREVGIKWFGRVSSGLGDEWRNEPVWTRQQSDTDVISSSGLKVIGSVSDTAGMVGEDMQRK